MLLRQKCEGECMQKMGKRAANARILLDHLYSSPIVNAQDVANVLQISVVSAYNLIEIMEENGILRQMNDYKRNKLYCFYDYMELIQYGLVQAEQATFVSLFLNVIAVKRVGLPIKDFFIWATILSIQEGLLFVTKYRVF